MDFLPVETPLRFEDIEPEAGAALLWWVNEGRHAVATLYPHLQRNGCGCFDRAFVAVHSETGRNDPCPCGSMLKFKRCCGGVMNVSPQQRDRNPLAGYLYPFRGYVVSTP